MKKQIQSREDIEFLVDAFYKKVLKNTLIGHFFTEVAQFGLEQHMPVMYSFWEYKNAPALHSSAGAERKLLNHSVCKIIVRALNLLLSSRFRRL
jgi:truncated hemoglobin YjbI